MLKKWSIFVSKINLSSKSSSDCDSMSDSSSDCSAMSLPITSAKNWQAIDWLYSISGKEMSNALEVTLTESMSHFSYIILRFNRAENPTEKALPV